MQAEGPEEEWPPAVRPQEVKQRMGAGLSN